MTCEVCHWDIMSGTMYEGADEDGNKSYVCSDCHYNLKEVEIVDREVEDD